MKPVVGNSSHRRGPGVQLRMTLDQPRSLDDLVRAGDVAMLTTIDDDHRLTSRPLTVAEAHGGVLTFLVDAEAGWFATLERALEHASLDHRPDAVDAVDRPSEAAGPAGATQVILAITTGRNEWLSVRGRPAISADPTTIDRLWSPAAGAFFDGRDDPSIRALQVSLLDGEYWSAPGGGALGRLAAVVGAALGRDDDTPGGAHGEIARD